jgi:hypothetical protein
VTVGHGLDQSGVGRTPAVEPGPVGFDPGFVEENEAVRVEAEGLEDAELRPGRGDIRPRLLSGDERFL